MFRKARYHLPLAHQPAMAVPRGGSSCATCRFYVPDGVTWGQCFEPNYKRYYGTTQIPCRPDAFCSDWYQPAPGVPVGC